MRNSVRIENIEQMRLHEGIDDVELQKEIRTLKVGDFVKLTLLARAGSFETLVVRITRINGAALRGKLAGSPISKGLSDVRFGSPLAFTAAHIHSIPKGHAPDEL